MSWFVPSVLRVRDAPPISAWIAIGLAVRLHEESKAIDFDYLEVEAGD